jgi:hypothetical protein
MSLLDDASLLVTPNAEKEGKLYSIIPTNGNGDFSVTRATTATRVNASGLVELVPYNLLTYSEMFSNAAWTKSGSTISANTTTAPNGTLTADTLIENTANTTHQIFQSITSGIIGANQYTATLYVKQYSTSNRNIALRIQDNAFTFGGVIAVFNPTTGALVTSSTTLSGVIVSTSSTLVNGFYRISVTFTIASSTAFRYDVVLYNGTNNTYLGDGASGVNIWGTQLNEGGLLDYQMTETRLNIPRLDYSLGSCPNILLEPQRTNNSRWSEDLTQSIWTKASGVTITADNTISPSGVQNADRVSGATGAAIWASPNTLSQSIGSLPSSTLCTMTIYLRSSTTSSQVTLVLRDQTTGNTSSLVCNLTSSWQRFEISRTTGAATTGLGVVLGAATADFFAWGLQGEVGAYATSYIPTTSASVTRNADVVQKTGASALIGQTSGTIFIDLNFTNVGTEKYIASIGDNTFTNFISLRRLSTGEIRIIFAASTSSGTTNASSAILPNGRYKIAYKYASGSLKLFINGALSFSLTPTFTFGSALQNIKLGMDSANAIQLGDRINSMALFPTPLTDTQCIALTT